MKKITCREYNRRWREKGLGYVVRYLLGKWVVCDGFAPDSDYEVDENALFCGHIACEFDNFEDADAARVHLNIV